MTSIIQYPLFELKTRCRFKPCRSLGFFELYFSILSTFDALVCDFLFCIEGIPKLLGKDQKTIKFFVKQNKTLFESIGFNMSDHYEKLIQNHPIDIAYVIGENVWNGKKTIQLELKDIKLSQNHA